jgi:putative ABC transport system permease protein
MKAIDVRDQVSLSLKRCLQLTVRGIRYRLFRSLITVIIVSLAVAFLMMMLSTSYIDRQVGQDVRAQTTGRRLLAEWVDKLSIPMNASALAAKLSEAGAGSPGWTELKNWGGLNDDELVRLKDAGHRQQVYERFLGRIKPGERAALVGSREGGAVFEDLQSPQRQDEFFKNVRNVRMSFPTDRERFEAFERDYAQTRPLRQRALDGHAKAVQGLRARLGVRHVTEVFAQGGPETRAMLEQHGFVLQENVYAALEHEAKAEVDAGTLVSLQQRNKRVRGAIAKRAGVDVKDIKPQHVFEITSSLRGAKWLKEEADKAIAESANNRQKLIEEGKKPQESEAPEGLALSAERIEQVSSEKLRINYLAEIESRLPDEDQQGWLGFSARTGWLIIISFMVCVVGVANAMLMSVTERFREIATMKCLGALDSFIMIIFVMESSLQGLAGGLAGVVLGLLLGIVRSIWGFGTLALTNLPAMLLVFSAGLCLVAGVILAAMAAVYPAWVAARLAPMEAMRIE